MPENEISVSGTLIWYYCICKREVWLISHQLTPDQDDTNIAIGRIIDATSYSREKKQLAVGASKMDIYRLADGKLIVAEVKKSSKYCSSARMQLGFYLKELAARGIEATGELRFPEEKTKELVELDEKLKSELDQVERDILRIVYLDQPPPPVKNKYCKTCGYVEFCWV
jgi:CRISPR-associated exonuclease Cas4